MHRRNWCFTIQNPAQRRPSQRNYRNRFPLFEPKAIENLADRKNSRTPDEQLLTEEEFSDDEILSIKQEIIGSLPPHERELYRARFEEHVKLAELAERYGISKEAVGMRLTRISAKLREKVKIYFQNDR